MSFGADFKTEILERTLTTNAEKFAFVSAVLRVCGSIHIDSKGVNIEVVSEHYALVAKFTAELKSLYGDISVEIRIKDRPGLTDKLYTVILPADYTERISDDTGYIRYMGGQAVGFSDGIENEFGSEEEIKAYLLGIVAGSVSISVPQMSEADENIYIGGYHLEMTFINEHLAYDVMNYLAQYDIFMKKINRGDTYGLYLKDSNMISDFMAFFGAGASVMEINHIMVARDIRNDINRRNNCVLANLDKTIEAGNRQYQAIKAIEKYAGLDQLPEKLRIIAEIRLAHPEYSLDDIADELGGNISKSGINHRLRRIVDIASKLTEEGEAEEDE